MVSDDSSVAVTDNVVLPCRRNLDGATQSDQCQGLGSGVFRDCRREYNNPDLIFRWPTGAVRADMGDCPDLELVLPAYKEAVENFF